jgi:hypothetical protein
MTKVLFIFMLILVACSVNSQQKETGTTITNQSNGNMAETKNNPNIKDVLGKERTARIAKAKQVTIYRVKEFVTDAASQTKGRTYFADYEVLGSGKLNKKKSKDLKRTLLNANNYPDLEFVNKCTFTARIGLEITTKKEKIIALVSYPCKKILFLENGQEFYRDLQSVQIINQIAQEFFKDLPEAN